MKNLLNKSKEISSKILKEHISLTLMLLSFAIFNVVGLFEILGKIKSSSPFNELFYTCVGLYFGRSYMKDKKSKEE